MNILWVCTPLSDTLHSTTTKIYVILKTPDSKGAFYDPFTEEDSFTTCVFTSIQVVTLNIPLVIHIYDQLKEKHCSVYDTGKCTK